MDKPYLDSVSPDHSNVQLINPQGEMVTSFDVWSLNKSDGATNLYFNNERLGVVSDGCKADNAVVRDAVQTGRAPVLTGSGPEVLSKWLQMAELAHRAAYNPDLTYMRYPSADNNPQNKQFNSNSLPYALVEGVGLESPPSFDRLSGGDSMFDVLPGRDRGEALKDILLKGGQPYFASVPPSEIGDPKHRARLEKIVDGLKLETVQAGICNEAKNTTTCAAPVAP